MIFLLTIFFVLSSFHQSYGINEFTTTQNIDYQFSDTGTALVNHKISIYNNFSQFYPKEYSLTLTGTNATDIQTYDEMGNIPTQITQNNNTIKLSLTLSNPKTGKDQVTAFNIRYKSNSLSQKKGKTWEISLPQFQDSLGANTNMNLNIPTSFGKLSSSPNKAIISTTPQGTNLNFTKFNSQEKFILTFGDYQLFNFELNFHLQNSTDQSSLLSIPLPPDTANQKIFFEKIEPLPLKIENDIDGNWLAVYELASQSNIDVTAKGQAKIGQNINYQNNSKPILENQLYWPIDNSEILNLSKTYNTPKKIYDYVVSTLSYDYNRINNSARRGALKALENPETSLCTDFTDLFVTVARSAGIGAREIEGYAYSNNTNIKPLLTGTDILHAWPEYYDSKNNKWISIDPTWAKTTGGINYFDDLDLNHFAFVIHNSKSDSPSPPGSYKTSPNQKSVDISFAQIETIPVAKNPIITTKFNPFSKSYLIVKNPNLFTLDNFSILNQTPQNILPLGEITLDFPKISFYSSLLTKNQNIKISETITIQNPYHFLNLFIVIISGIILLSFGAIILLRHK
jgi:hypothetical protein